MEQSKHVSIRINPVAYRTLQTNAEARGLTVTRYLKEVAMENELESVIFPLEDSHKVVVQLNRIGRDLNEIAKVMHESRYDHTKFDEDVLKQTEAELIQVRDAVRDLSQRIG